MQMMAKKLGKQTTTTKKTNPHEMEYSKAKWMRWNDFQ